MASRSRSRSPLHSESNASNDRASPTPSHASSAVSATSNISLTPINYYNLRMSNVPTFWKWWDVLNYIKKHADKVDKAIADDIAYIPMKKSTDLIRDCLIQFKTERMRNQAFDLLKRTNEKVKGRKLFVIKIARDKKLNGFKEPSQRKLNSSHFIEDDNETYGLSTDYLRKLGITPPLTRRVLVRYLPNNYEELKIRKLFNIAGAVVSVNLINNSLYTHAIVEYSHPVEAVQAVSMFGIQNMFENKIRCDMVNKKKKQWVNGMSALGPGLGPNGAPMKGIRASLEIKKIKAEVMAEFNKVLDSIDELKSQIHCLVQAQNKTTTPNPLKANPTKTLSNLTNQFQPMQLLQSLVQPITGIDTTGILHQNMTGSNMNMQDNMQSGLNTNMHGNLNMQSPNNQGNTNMEGGHTQNGSNMQSSPFVQRGQQIPNMQTGYTNMQNMQPFGLHQQMNTGFGNQQYNINTDNFGARNAEARVLFKNLPASVTKPFLKAKMREVGDVKFIRMKYLGRALVSFFSDNDADKCIRLFNQSRVGGQIIEVQKEVHT